MKNENLVSLGLENVSPKTVLVSIFAAVLLALSLSHAATLGQKQTIVWHNTITKTMPVARAAERTIALSQSHPAPVVPMILPAVISRVLPEYPVAARRAGIEGIVQARILVGTDGAPKAVVISQTSGSMQLDQSAKAALLQWRFSPAMQKGTAQEFSYQIPVRFQIHGS